jgi:hypothetical protein
MTLKRNGPRLTTVMRPATVVRLATAGTRTDILRVLLTAFSAALASLAVLAALTVLAITPPAGTADGSAAFSNQYTIGVLREPGLRPGVAITLLLLTIPVLVLAGQCARIGAPARDRRLAAMRMAGATPRQTATIAAVDTGAASLLGALAGLGAYFALHALLHRPDAQGRLPLPTDVLPSSAALVAAVLGLPVLATFTAALMLRRVTMSPFGLIRQNDRGRTPRPWPAVLILLGLAGNTASHFVASRYGRALEDPVVPLLYLGSSLCAVLGVVLGTGWISYTAGRVLHRYARRPAALLAARRLQADPWSGSRTFAALLACVVFSAGSVTVRAWFAAQHEAQGVSEQLYAAAQNREHWPRPPLPTQFHLDTMDLLEIAALVALGIAAIGLLVALAEGVVSRHRTHAALTAAGVPRGVLGRALAWQTFAPLLPATLLALTLGTLLARGIGTKGFAPGGSVCQQLGDGCTGQRTNIPDVVREAQLPLQELALYGLGTLVLALAAWAAGLLFLRNSTDLDELRAT